MIALFFFFIPLEDHKKGTLDSPITAEIFFFDSFSNKCKMNAY